MELQAVTWKCKGLLSLLYMPENAHKYRRYFNCVVFIASQNLASIFREATITLKRIIGKQLVLL